MNETTRQHVVFSAALAANVDAGPFPRDSWFVATAAAYPVLASVYRADGSVQQMHIHGADAFRIAAGVQRMSFAAAVTLTVATERDALAAGLGTVPTSAVPSITTTPAGFTLIGEASMDSLVASLTSIEATKSMIISVNSAGVVSASKQASSDPLAGGIDLLAFPSYRRFQAIMWWLSPTGNPTLTPTWRGYADKRIPPYEPSVGAAQLWSVSAGAVFGDGQALLYMGDDNISAPNISSGWGRAPAPPPWLVPQLAVSTNNLTGFTRGYFRLFGAP